MVNLVYDYLTVRPKNVIQEKNKLTKLIKCDDTSKLKEYIGYKVKYNHKENWIKLMQPVLIKSFWDEFSDLLNNNPSMPAMPETTLQKIELKLNVESRQKMPTYQKE